MRVLLDTWRRQRRERPLATGFLHCAIAGAGLAAALVIAGRPLLAQLVAGLALIPLSVATGLYLIPAQPWSDGGDDWRRDDGRGPDPDPAPGGPAIEVDWERFEREFRGHAEARERIGARP